MNFYQRQEDMFTGVLSGYEQYLSNYLHLSSYAGNISQKTMISVCLMEDNGYVSMA